jgi:hypothetical protein
MLGSRPTPMIFLGPTPLGRADIGPIPLGLAGMGSRSALAEAAYGDLTPLYKRPLATLAGATI